MLIYFNFKYIIYIRNSPKHIHFISISTQNYKLCNTDLQIINILAYFILLCLVLYTQNIYLKLINKYLINFLSADQKSSVLHHQAKVDFSVCFCFDGTKYCSIFCLKQNVREKNMEAFKSEECFRLYETKSREIEIYHRNINN